MAQSTDSDIRDVSPVVQQKRPFTVDSYNPSHESNVLQAQIVPEETPDRITMQQNASQNEESPNP